jgi:nucleoside-diphosphate-sugar epimerase
MSPSIPQTVLVTGAFGNVGRYTVRRLLEQGLRVVATDIRSEKTEAVAADLAASDLIVRWLDLRDGDAVRALVAEVAPYAVLHLAAVIPPMTYANPKLARAVNVDGTGNLVAAVEALESPCRLVLASSIAVYGSRNPRRDDVLTATTPVRPRDAYGAHKVAAEALVTRSGLDWVILRLGGVMFPEMSLSADPDLIVMEGLLPQDGRIETVDVRDVAAALVAAVHAACVGKVLLIGGGPGNRLTQQQVGHALTAAIGLRGVLPSGRPGDAADDDAWFVTDWMDTNEAQSLLGFQSHSFADTMGDLAAAVGLKRYLLMLVVPFARLFLWWRSPLRGSRTTVVPLWSEVEGRWGAEALAPRPPH